ncbi:MAG: hypothetical protein MZV70_77190 [Desulfobacterales bacterium]|nr:hypothetical protein [Desulfobacterales bacterium]
MLGPGEVLEVDVSLSAPADLAMGHTCRLVLRAAWTPWEFLTSCLTIDLVIPSPGALPEGPLLHLRGRYCRHGP